MLCKKYPTRLRWGKERKLSLGRIRIITIAIAFSNPTIFAMNEKFGLLVASYFSCLSYCLFLSIEFLSNPSVMLASYTPPIRSFYDMLILAHLYFVWH